MALKLHNYDSRLFNDFKNNLGSQFQDVGINNQGELEGLKHVEACVTNLKNNEALSWNNLDANKLSKTPPFEVHPYIERGSFPVEKHKTLLLGTFPPPSYLHENYPELSNGPFLKKIKIDHLPNLSYFYGNRGSLWDILGLTLTVEEIKTFLNQNGIFISDSILALQRKSLTKSRAADNNLVNILPNYPLIDYLINGEHNIDTIVFTSKKWSVTDNLRQGRRAGNYIPDTMELGKENSTINCFLFGLFQLSKGFSFQLRSDSPLIPFVPHNYSEIKDTLLSAPLFYLVLQNGKRFRLLPADSPSGNNLGIMDSSIFRSWIYSKYGEIGLHVLNSHPRNKKTDKIKRKRKPQIQKKLGLNAGEDITMMYLYELYKSYLERDLGRIETIIGYK